VNEAVLQAAQFESTLLKVRTSSAQSIGVPSIPSVQWEDVGGLVEVKNEILDTIQLPLDHPELFLQGLKKRSGTSTVNTTVVNSEVYAFRCPFIWSPWNRKDPTCQGGCNILLIKLSLCQRTRTSEYVHW